MAFPLFGSNAVPYATIKRKKLPTNSIANALLSGTSPQLNPPIYSGETKELLSYILSAIRTRYEAEIDAENQAIIYIINLGKVVIYVVYVAKEIRGLKCAPEVLASAQINKEIVKP